MESFEVQMSQQLNYSREVIGFSQWAKDTDDTDFCTVFYTLGHKGFALRRVSAC